MINKNQLGVRNNESNSAGAANKGPSAKFNRMHEVYTNTSNQINQIRGKEPRLNSQQSPYQNQIGYAIVAHGPIHESSGIDNKYGGIN